MTTSLAPVIDLASHSGHMPRRRIAGLYAITPDGLDTDELLRRSRLVLSSGAQVLQYRNKQADAGLRQEQALALRRLTHEFGALFIVNDDEQLAAQVEADGVHLGAEDGEIAAARALLGAERIIGASCYNRAELARQAVADGADYVAFGAFYPSSVKPDAVKADSDLLRQDYGVPVVAIGGITQGNGGILIEAGADALAVISAVFDAADVTSAAQGFSKLFAGRNDMTSHNQELFDESQKLIPGGVNSPVRAFRSVGGTPLFFKRGHGAYVWDADDKRYIDYVNSWGPMIVGHCHPEVVKAVQDAAAEGLGFGAPTAAELEIAELLCKILPSLEMVRLVSSGTEATMTAIRLARGYTGRSRIIKFEGCYHGHSDGLLVKAGSGALTFGQPSSSGVPAEIAALTTVLDYNDAAGLEKAFAEYGDEIAAVIVEPVAGNMNLILPKREFLDAMRDLCTKHGAVLILDEVMSGFRVGLQGAHGHFNIKPDLITLGKVMGGGLPAAAFGGRRDIMQCLAPLGAVYQAGTLSGNPVAVAAGLATLKLVQAPGFYERLTQVAQQMTEGLTTAAKKHGIPFSAQSIGSMFGLYFSEKAPTSYAEVMACDKAAFNRFFHAMLAEGVYLAPSAFEAGFVSAAHSDADIAATIAAADKVFANW
ncbi:MAG: glutamate-1-semialdehyde 2,1-aminomutase [Nitrosomonadales bacterium]|nr:glutamate-1-semialdehyde 2,1-aminomutase [Nitrosomonadales bacterium]